MEGGLATLFNNPSYATTFGTFSPLRLFSPVDSNLTVARFFIPTVPGSAGDASLSFLDRRDASSAALAGGRPYGAARRH